MKISVNDVELFTLSDIQKEVICNDINRDFLDDDMKRRLQYILEHKYEQCFKRLKAEWEPKLIARGHQSLPTNPDAFAQLVFDQEDYLCRKSRDAEQSPA